MHRLKPGNLYVSPGGSKVFVVAVNYLCTFKMYEARVLMLDDQNTLGFKRYAFYSDRIGANNKFWRDNFVA